MKVKKFEELLCWQKSKELTLLVFAIATKLDVQKEFELKSQLKRATLSTMNNIAEGFGRYSDKDFIRFLDYASASATEVKSMIYLLDALGNISQKEAREIHKSADDVRNLSLALIRYLRKNSDSVQEQDAPIYGLADLETYDLNT